MIADYQGVNGQVLSQLFKKFAHHSVFVKHGSQVKGYYRILFCME